MKDIATVISEIEAQTAAGNHAAIPGSVIELEIAAIEVDQLEQSHFDALERLLENQSFTRMEESWRLLRFLDNNWHLLTATQRGNLRGTVVRVFGRFGDATGAFVASEILGGRYADAEALTTLSSLGQQARMPARALVPHGFETLALATDDQALRSRAVGELRLLAKAGCGEVRGTGRAFAQAPFRALIMTFVVARWLAPTPLHNALDGPAGGPAETGAHHYHG